MPAINFKVEGEGLPVVLIHGFCENHEMWKHLVPTLSKNYKVYTIDLPGFGQSPLWQTTVSLESVASAVADWVEDQKIDKAVFIGGSNKMPVHPDLIKLAQNGDSDAVKLMMKWGYEGSKKFIGGNPVEKIIQSPRDISEILATDLNACNNYSNGIEAAKTIDCPTMFIFGELDKMVSLEHAKKFANSVKDSITHVIHGSGHMIMIEKAFEMREKILEFLKK